MLDPVGLAGADQDEAYEDEAHGRTVAPPRAANGDSIDQLRAAKESYSVGRMAWSRDEVTTLVKTRLDELRAAHRPFDELLHRIDALGIWAVVGGAPRTWVLAPGVPPRDIDLAVDVSHTKLQMELLAFVDEGPGTERELVRRTGFGGFALRAGDVLVDAWAARRVLGMLRPAVEGDAFRATADAAPFTLDSLVVTSTGVVYDAGFFDTLETRTLRLVRAEPAAAFPMLAAKARRYCETLGFVADDKLAAFIAAHASSPA
jgi:hypothetical protein